MFYRKEMNALKSFANNMADSFVLSLRKENNNRMLITIVISFEQEKLEFV